MTKTFKCFYNFITDSDYRFNLLNSKGLLNWIPDDIFIKYVFKKRVGYTPNLTNPQTFNEKLQWLKLYDRNPLYTTLVDKYAVKKWVADKIGEEYIIPTLGVWNSFDEINFDKLPNQFVLKTTHDSGGIVIVRNKQTFDKQAARKKLTKSLKHNYYYHTREWAYKGVCPRIIAEPYLEDARTKELRDYKFFCFNGKPKMMFIASDRQNTQEETKFDFFGMEFKHLPFTNGHPNSTKHLEKPQSFEKMKELAGILAQNIPHVRVDFYEISGKIYFGEMTFSHWSGFMSFNPSQWDKKIGDWLTLPQVKQI